MKAEIEISNGERIWKVTWDNASILNRKEMKKWVGSVFSKKYPEYIPIMYKIIRIWGPNEETRGNMFASLEVFSGKSRWRETWGTHIPWKGSRKRQREDMKNWVWGVFAEKYPGYGLIAYRIKEIKK